MHGATPAARLEIAVLVSIHIPNQFSAKNVACNSPEVFRMLHNRTGEYGGENICIALVAAQDDGGRFTDFFWRWTHTHDRILNN